MEGCRFDACRGHSRKDCHRRGIPSRKRVGLRALGVRLPLLPLHPEAWPSGKAARCYRVGGLSAVRRLTARRLRLRLVTSPARNGIGRGRLSSPAASAFRSGVVESARRATVTREAQVRALPPELSRPRGRNGDDAGPSTRKLRVRVPPGVLIERSSGCRGVGHPAGFGRRRSQVRLLPARPAR